MAKPPARPAAHTASCRSPAKAVASTLPSTMAPGSTDTRNRSMSLEVFSRITLAAVLWPYSSTRKYSSISDANGSSMDSRPMASPSPVCPPVTVTSTGAVRRPSAPASAPPGQGLLGIALLHHRILLRGGVFLVLGRHSQGEDGDQQARQGHRDGGRAPPLCRSCWVRVKENTRPSPLYRFIGPHLPWPWTSAHAASPGCPGAR